MANPFYTHIQSALADANLQSALDANAERRLRVRLQSYASLPEDVHVLRRRAHELRARTIAHLEQYLEEFAARAAANGMTVHRAANAAQAQQIVLDIARSHGVKTVAKAKTMVGEEIGINAVLEAAGMEVVETDLGEYIVQLRGERPTHIITPAVHLRRQDVGQTFHEKLGTPYSDDVSALTETARRELRRVFLQADMGITGANFGVVETGSLCVLTNEGNGRMCSTLPPVHVALVGIERLVPTLDDLALLLSLLPRSATGQKLTVYTSLLNGPRRPDEPDGPQERHIVLVDNGRSRLRQSPLMEALYCIRCGACLNACPVFREIGGHAYVGAHGAVTPYPGPIGSVIAPGLFGQSEFGQLARASSLCGACREACPVDIDLPKLLLRVRAGGVDLPVQDTLPTAKAAFPNAPRQLSLALRSFVWAARSPRRFALAQKTAGVLSRLAPRSSGSWLRLPAWTGWGYSRDFPAPAARSFRQRWQAGIAGEEETVSPQDLQPVQVIAEQAPVEQPAPESRLERFSRELEALGGTVQQCTEAELPQALAAFLKSRRIRSVLAWENEHLPEEVLDAVRAARIRVEHTYRPHVELSTRARPQAGLTAASGAAAETGTLLITAGKGRPLTASLVADIHVAVLKKADIYATLAEVLRREDVQQASAAVLISGPSRTADIEMTLTVGVHGPREVHVFCITEGDKDEAQG